MLTAVLTGRYTRLVTSEFRTSTRTAASLLLVEDDPQLVRAIAPAFEVSGFQVTVATTGGEAINLVDNGRWDALVVDLGLPDMDGTTVICHLRNRYDTPVIVISAQHSGIEVEAARSAGANCFLHKPFRTPDLLHWVNEWISTPKSLAFAEV